MRILSFIAALLCLISVEASHLMGGEITYTYLSGNTYRFDVTLYRDCNECTIGNQGGGSSTSNCNDLDELYIRTITSSCGNTFLNPITLTKTGFTNITPVCDLENSVCGTNPTIPYGFEAHHYTGTIDFSKYTIYTDCMFEVFFLSPERNEHINILAQEEQKLYVSAQINPWKENKSSPQFASFPTILFPENEPAYGGDYVTQADGDSLVYKWVQPLKNYNTPIPYSSGYSAQHFIDAYCLTGSNCTPDHTVTPPRGLYLNTSSGDYAFTPTSSSQHGTRVVEVEQWRKKSGTYYLAGKVKRDIIVIVNSSSNHIPKIVANDVYETCVGETFNLTISAVDNPLTTLGTNDSVALEAIHTLTGLTTTSSAITSAPYQSLTLNIKTDNSHIGKHLIRIKAQDNQCPMYGQSEKTITLIVHPTPQATFTINDVFCGNNAIEVITTDTLEYLLNINGSESTEELPFTYTNYQPEAVNYKFTYTDNYGCRDSFEQTIDNIGNSAVAPAQINGSTTSCEGSPLNHWLTHSDLVVYSVNWEIANTNYPTDTLIADASSEKIQYTYTLEKNASLCELQDSFNITIQKAPKITLNTEPTLCFVPLYDLSTVDISPKDGQWSYNNNPVSTFFELGQHIPNLDTDAELTYSITDNATQCEASLAVILKVKQAPELELQNQQICAGDNPFNLNNIIRLPFRYSTANIDWKMLTKLGAYYHDGLTPKIDVPTYGPGEYILAAENTLPNGCIARDTATLLVKDELDLSYNGLTSACQTDIDILLDTYFEVNTEGGNWSSDVPDIIFYDTLRSVDYCGSTTLEYFYDRNGCYDVLSIPLNIVCKPAFNLQVTDSICSDASKIDLPSAYLWEGTSIYDNILDPSILISGYNKIKASTGLLGCTFDTTFQITSLTPINFTVNQLPTKICEGEELALEINAPTYAKLSLENCNGNIQSIDNTHTYVPTNCDLAKNRIELLIQSSSSITCPSHSLLVSTTYLDNPKVELAVLEPACAPYDLDYTLETNEILEMDYTLSGNATDWDGKGNSVKANRLAPGVYSLLLDLTHTNGCTAVQNISSFLSVNPTPQAQLALLGEDRVTLSKRQIMLSSYSTISSGQLTNKWYYTKEGVSTLFSSQDNPILELPLDTGVFMLSLISESNKYCRDTASTTVTVVPDIIAFIPNAFTPDNKGPESNSAFRVTSDHASKFHIEIFNKWGQKVFSSDNIEEAWDGTFLGQYCQNGVYVYAIELVNHAGSLYKYQGTVNLLR